MSAVSLKNSTVRRLVFTIVIGALCSINGAHGQNGNHGDWRNVGTWKMREKIYTIYYSPSRTIRKNGLVRAWFKVAYPDDDRTSHLVNLVQFNCQTGKYRLLQQSIFSRDSGGTGSIKPTEWQYPDPESVPEIQYRLICRQAKVANSRR